MRPLGEALVGAVDQMILAYLKDGVETPEQTSFWDGMFTEEFWPPVETEDWSDA